MNTATSPLSQLGREALLQQINAELALMDDASLALLAQRLRTTQTAPAQRSGSHESPAQEQGIDRRQFLRTVFGVGALGAVATAGVGYAAWEFGGLRERTQAELELGAEIVQLRGLLALYDALEQVGLDDIVESGLEAASGGLRLLEKGADVLNGGLQAVEDFLRKLDEAFPDMQTGIAVVEAGVSFLADGLQRLEDILSDFMEPAQPVTTAISKFVDQVLGYLPFGVGDTIRQGLQTIAELMTSIPEHVEAVNSALLEPLRERWFNTDPEQGLLSGLFAVLINRVLDPLEAHLTAISAFSETWQDKLALPARAAIAHRQQLRVELQGQRQSLGI